MAKTSPKYVAFAEGRNLTHCHFLIWHDSDHLPTRDDVFEIMGHRDWNIVMQGVAFRSKSDAIAFKLAWQS